MKPCWDQIWDAKLAQIFAASAERDDATAILAPVIASSEGHRVAVACLKLAGGSLKKLKKWAQAALPDYREILAWADIRDSCSWTSERLQSRRRLPAAQMRRSLRTGSIPPRPEAQRAHQAPIEAVDIDRGEPLPPPDRLESANSGLLPTDKEWRPSAASRHRLTRKIQTEALLGFSI